VRAKTEEFLNLLLWSADTLTRPTFRNLTDSFESWAYRNGLLRQICNLEKRELLERAPNFRKDRLCRLTEKGRLRALGGRDPELRWARPWDGQWRLVLFDVPIEHNKQRDLLRRYLRNKAFGCLQNSVWITPDPATTEKHVLAKGRVNVESLLLLEARPCAGESDSEIVQGAWDFEAINQRYVKYLNVLDRFPDSKLEDAKAAKALQRWATEEHQSWLNAVTLDPLLPEPLLPRGYAGPRAWRRRKETLTRAGDVLRSFKG